MKKTLKKIAFLILFVSMAFGTTVGPTLVGSGADGGGGTSCAWVNPGNITLADGVFTTCTAGGAGLNTNFIVGDMAGNAFTVTPGSTILGIQVDISRLASIATDTLDLHVRIRKAGVATGTDLSAAAAWPTVQGTASFGGAANLWGTTWTSTDVNATNFGAQFQANITTTGDVASVDWVKITVTFTPPSGMGKRRIVTQTRTVHVKKSA